MMHTKGPWEVVQCHYDIRITDVKPCCDRKWDLTFYAQDEVPLDEHMANCRLVSAAPDLLESLELLVAGQGNDVGDYAKWKNALRNAKKAIRKAKGV